MALLMTSRVLGAACPMYYPTGSSRVASIRWLSGRGPDDTAFQPSAAWRSSCRSRGLPAEDMCRVGVPAVSDGAGMNVIDAGHAHPFADDTKVHAMVLLPRAGRIPRPLEVQDHVVPARPFGHGSNRGVADHEIDHDDGGAERFDQLGTFVHVLHRSRGDVQVMAIRFACRSRSAIHGLHAIEGALMPMHERLRVYVLVVLHKVEAAL